MNLFAITEFENQEIIFRIPLSQGIQNEVSIQFTNLFNEFFEGKTVVNFDGAYKADNDELFRIENYPINEDMINAATNALEYDILNIQEFEGKIKGIFATQATNGDIKIFFQVFDTRKIIANKGIPLFNNNGTYTRFDNKGIVITEDLTVVYKDNSIFFSSYFNAKRILDLADYYEEATNVDVDEFTGSETFDFEDVEDFKDELNSNFRKKIKSIQDSEVLLHASPNNLQTQANSLGLDLDFNNGKITVYKDKDYIKKLLKFLDEDYFKTILTGRTCVTNSKREV